MDVFAAFQNRVAEALKAEFPNIDPALLERFTIEPPRDPSHGDLSTNAAMLTGKPLGRAPRDIAAALARRFAGDPDVVSVEVAGPGFVNFRVKPAAWQSVVETVSKAGVNFGRCDLGHAGKLNVEYVSANPTGPMHVGHTRGAVYGDALAALMEFAGYKVTREYYVNDAGAQVDSLARSAFLRYREALGEAIGTIPESLYPGDYLVPVGEALKARFGKALLGKPEAEWLPVVRAIAVAAMMALIRADLARLGIRHEHFFSESSLHGPDGDIVKTLAWLRDQGMVYQGRLESPKGAVPEDWEDREQTLFRASQFGDDADRALIKSDGGYTYFAADIAYHRNKYLRGFKQQVAVLGADHVGYVKRLTAALKAVSGGAAEIDVKLCQLVNLMRAGQPVKMSKRAGTFVNAADLVDEVGPDAVRFIMLFRKNDAPLDFDFDLVTQKTRENPVFYVQYAHARCCSVFRAAGRDLPDLDTGAPALASADLSLLATAQDLGLLRLVAGFPRSIES
ncbi:MAG: arginine--tRNA ligase, partial [Cucumibacter sp.]